jgi:hypothetical protein
MRRCYGLAVRDEPVQLVCRLSIDAAPLSTPLTK